MTVIAATGANKSTTTSISWLWSPPCPAMRFSRRGSTQEEIESNTEPITSTTVDTIKTETIAEATGDEAFESTIVTTTAVATAR
jgi:hypothetical protein